MAKTVSARLAPRTVQLCKVIATAVDRPPHKKAIAALAAVGVDLLHRVMIELGEIAPDVGEGIPSYPQADEFLTSLRKQWADDPDVEALAEELAASRCEAARWKKMHGDFMAAIAKELRDWRAAPVRPAGGRPVGVGNPGGRGPAE